MNNRIVSTSVLVAIGALALIGTASAATSWTFTTGSNSATGTEWGNTRGPDSGTGVTAQAWSSTGGTNNTTLETAYLAVYGSNGLGVNNRDGASSGTCGTGAGTVDCGDLLSTVPEHAIDNNQRYDSVLFSFTNKINLNSVTLGYPPSSSTTLDSDLTILAYTGSDGSYNPGTAFSGQTYQQLVNTGNWSFITNLADVSDQPGMTGNISTSVYSKYWIIGTYIPLTQNTNPDIGCTTTLQNQGKCATGDDYAKIKTVSGNYKVPEPGSLALLGIALTTAGFVRRRVSKK